MNRNNTRPHVLIVSEITVDGKLTLGKGISSKILMQYMDHQTEILLHKTRVACDAIMVGSNTIRIDNSFLTVRYAEGENPIRVVPSRMADLPPEANIFNADAPTIIATSTQASEENIQRIKETGASVVIAGETSVDLTRLMTILCEEYNVKTLMVEGGPTLNYQMLSAGLVDEIRLIHLPFIVGGEDTPSLVGGMSITSEDEMIRLHLKNHYLCGTNLVTEYDVLYNKEE